MNVKKLIYTLFDAVTLPLCRIGVVAAIISRLAYQRKRVQRREIEARLRAQGLYGDEVQRGPFAGVKYLEPERYASCRFEKLIGAYEHELHELLTRLAKTKSYKTIVNVGAAEGFYTVGLAKLFPSARILMYESTAEGRGYARDLCLLNGVERRVDFHGTCSMSEFATLEPEGPALLLMDIDLGERELLDPARVPWLHRVDVLVELHECLRAGTNELIRDRMVTTHSIEQISNAGLRYADFPPLKKLRFDEVYAMVGEDRLGLQDWFYMEPKA